MRRFIISTIACGAVLAFAMPLRAGVSAREVPVGSSVQFLTDDIASLPTGSIPNTVADETAQAPGDFTGGFVPGSLRSVVARNSDQTLTSYYLGNFVTSGDQYAITFGGARISDFGNFQAIVSQNSPEGALATMLMRSPSRRPAMIRSLELKSGRMPRISTETASIC
jgi:hypothetical protein